MVATIQGEIYEYEAKKNVSNPVSCNSLDILYVKENFKTRWKKFVCSLAPFKIMRLSFLSLCSDDISNDDPHSKNKNKNTGYSITSRVLLSALKSKPRLPNPPHHRADCASTGCRGTPAAL